MSGIVLSRSGEKGFLVLFLMLEKSSSFSLLSISVIYGFTLEKAMAPHSSTLTWKIPWMEEPGRLQSMGLLRLGHD